MRLVKSLGVRIRPTPLTSAPLKLKRLVITREFHEDCYRKQVQALGQAAVDGAERDVRANALQVLEADHPGIVVEFKVRLVPYLYPGQMSSSPGPSPEGWTRTILGWTCVLGLVNGTAFISDAAKLQSSQVPR